MQTPQRVDVPSTSNDTTAPRIVRQAKRIHQRRTRSNIPMPAIPEETTYDNWYDSSRPPRSEKKKAKKPKQISPIVQPAAPAPMFEEIQSTGGAPDPRVPMVSQDDDDNIINEIPRGLGFPMQIPVPRPAPPRRSPRINLPSYNRANAAIFVCQEALYEYLAHALEAPKIFTPDSLKAATLNVPDGNIDLQEFCGGVSHPDTGENITSYRKLLKIRRNPEDPSRPHGYLRQNRYRLPRAKGRPKPRPHHSRRQPHRLPWRTDHPYGRPYDHQAPLEQRHQHARRQVHVRRHQEFLFGNPPRSI